MVEIILIMIMLYAAYASALFITHEYIGICEGKKPKL